PDARGCQPAQQALRSFSPRLQPGAPEELHVKERIVPITFAACCIPALFLIAQALTSGFGANPVEEVLNDLGYIAFVLLVLTLACTPAQIILGLKWPIRVRK